MLNNLNGFLLLVLMLLITQITFADELDVSKSDFTFVANIGSGKQSLRQFELPYEVLQGLQRQDYGDMRIFNSQNQNLPFTVKVIKPHLQQHNSEYALEFFTLPKNPYRYSRLKIEIDKYNSRWHFSSTTSTNNNKRDFVIIKNPYTDKNLYKLKLHWVKINTAFNLKLKLEQSDDLEHWRTIKRNATLYDLKHFSTALVKDTISLSLKSKAKYLRLSFKNNHHFLHSITAIKGFYHHQSQPIHENWKTLALKPGELAHEWLFDTESVAPIAKIAFDIPQAGLFYQGSLFSRSKYSSVEYRSRHKSQLKQEIKKILHHPVKKRTEKAYDFWRYRQGFTQYRLVTESGEINSLEFSVAAIKDNQWRILLKQPLTLLLEQVPKIEIAWYPVMVTFLAQGDAPYRILFGNETMKPLVNSQLPELLDNDVIEVVTVGKVSVIERVMSIDSSSQRFSNWFGRLNWKTGLLWLLLCFGVLLMAVMAYKLYSAMNR